MTQMTPLSGISNTGLSIYDIFTSFLELIFLWIQGHYITVEVWLAAQFRKTKPVVICQMGGKLLVPHSND